MMQVTNLADNQPPFETAHWHANHEPVGRADPPTQVDTVILEIPAHLQYVNILSATVCAFLLNVEQIAEREILLYNLELAIQEISVNIVKHAYGNRGGRIQMKAALSHQPWQLTIHLYDSGVPFDPAQVPQPSLGELQEHGYGLFLVAELMDEVEYKHTEHGNTWKLVKHLSFADCA